jgi:hypothetical protein
MIHSAWAEYSFKSGVIVGKSCDRPFSTHQVLELTMDPVIPILLQAAATFGNAALGDLAKRSVGEAWDAAVGTIKRRFGAEHPAPALVDGLRNAAGNEVVTGIIRTQLEPYQIGNDIDVQAVVQHLKEVLAQAATVPAVQGVGTMHVKNLTGAVQNFGVQNFNNLKQP